MRSVEPMLSAGDTESSFIVVVVPNQKLFHRVYPLSSGCFAALIMCSCKELIGQELFSKAQPDRRLIPVAMLLSLGPDDFPTYVRSCCGTWDENEEWNAVIIHPRKTRGETIDSISCLCQNKF